MPLEDNPNVKASLVLDGNHIEDEGPIGEVSETERTIREKVIHVLTIYPRLNWSMLQVGVGTSLPPTIWKPVVFDMAKEGLLSITSQQATTPSGRIQVYTTIALLSNAPEV